MAEGEASGRPRRRWVLVLVAVFGIAVAGASGYALGRSSGEDLNRASDDARQVGERIGSARGTERGYREGLRAGKREGYQETYRKARRKTLREAGEQGTSPAPATRSCGDIATEGAGSYGVEGVNVICDIALQVARQWEMECASIPSGDCSVRAGFDCDYTQTGEELGSITCTDGNRRVTFQTGA
jgi:hypothetical protein